MAACPGCGKELSGEFSFCPFCAAPLVRPGREQRKTVTVLFCDVTGSTSLGETPDPEALRALLARYFDRMKGIVEAHGGTVEKFIGDAVMAVFGVPQATKTTRCARSRPRSRCATRCPRWASRHASASTPAKSSPARPNGSRLATRSTLRRGLQQAAAPQEIYIGDDTYGWSSRLEADRRRAARPQRQGPTRARLSARSAVGRPLRGATSPHGRPRDASCELPARRVRPGRCGDARASFSRRSAAPAWASRGSS